MMLPITKLRKHLKDEGFAVHSSDTGLSVSLQTCPHTGQLLLTFLSNNKSIIDVPMTSPNMLTAATLVWNEFSPEPKKSEAELVDHLLALKKVADTLNGRVVAPKKKKLPAPSPTPVRMVNIPVIYPRSN